MISLRLKTIASKVSKNDIVLDVGTDHAYLPIYLKQNKLCKDVFGSDISENALKSGYENIKRANVNIELFVSDGLKNINREFNTLIISGMGTNTICRILDQRDSFDKLIISSNNELCKLRTYMNRKGYLITNEEAVFDKGKYYDIITYHKGNEKLSFFELNFGKSNNKDYYNYLYKKELNILKKCKFKKKLSILRKLFYLKLHKK